MKINHKTNIVVFYFLLFGTGCMIFYPPVYEAPSYFPPKYGNIYLPNINIDNIYIPTQIEQSIQEHTNLLEKIENRISKIDSFKSITVRNQDLKSVDKQGRIKDLTKRKQESEKERDKVKDYIEKLENRKTLLEKQSKRNLDSEEYLEELDPYDFINFIGLTCGDHISKAIEIYGEPINENIHSYGHVKFNENFHMIIDKKSQKIESITIKGIEGVDFITSKGINDEKINLMGVRIHKIIESSLGEGVIDSNNEDYRHYSGKHVSLRLFMGKVDLYTTTEIFVNWHLEEC